MRALSHLSHRRSGPPGVGEGLRTRLTGSSTVQCSGWHRIRKLYIVRSRLLGGRARTASSVAAGILRYLASASAMAGKTQRQGPTGTIDEGKNGTVPVAKSSISAATDSGGSCERPGT